MLRQHGPLATGKYFTCELWGKSCDRHRDCTPLNVAPRDYVEIRWHEGATGADDIDARACALEMASCSQQK
jgi:hypothetical protein